MEKCKSAPRRPRSTSVPPRSVARLKSLATCCASSYVTSLPATQAIPVEVHCDFVGVRITQSGALKCCADTDVVAVRSLVVFKFSAKCENATCECIRDMECRLVRKRGVCMPPDFAQHVRMLLAASGARQEVLHALANSQVNSLVSRHRYRCTQLFCSSSEHKLRLDPASVSAPRRVRGFPQNLL